MDIAILAAGVGRRFGALKQFVSVAPDGATLLEVTLRDARRAGCDHAVVLVAPGHEDQARAMLTRRLQPDLAIDVIAQHADDLPVTVAVTRDRPWGTAHAAWCLRHAVRGPFLLFNADDHYGPGAPVALLEALDAERGETPDFAMLGYPLGATLSARGTVSRGLCDVDGHGWLQAVQESLAITATGVDDHGIQLDLDRLVSMNAWAFTPRLFSLLDGFLRRFLVTADLTRAEAHLPAAVNDAVARDEARVRVVPAPDPWCGMTWPEDRERVVARLAALERPRQAAAAFGLAADDAVVRPFGDGLIHETWRLDTRDGAHLLQRLNTHVFADPATLAVIAATAASRVDQALRRGGDTDPRHRLRFRTTAADQPWWRDVAGGIWRAMALIPNSRPATVEEAGAAAALLGMFPGLVASDQAPPLPAALPGLHDTPSHLASLRTAMMADLHGRCRACRGELDDLLAHAELATALQAQPRRLVHNDAKLDNVLVDATTGEALCVVDLDTVMPGPAAHDFGDLVRSAVTGRPEDEGDLDLIGVREDVFCDLATGYLQGAASWLTPEERASLLTGALVITWEQAVRFLADHLDSDRYYAVDDPGHNLRRARAQRRLLEVLLARRDELQAILDRVSF